MFSKTTIIDTLGNVVLVGTGEELCVSRHLLQKGHWKDPAKIAEVMVRDKERGGGVAVDAHRG